MSEQVQNAMQKLTLGELLPELGLVAPVATVEVFGVTLNSRTVEAGYVFIALKGQAFDGKDFIGDAIQSEACAVLVESDGDSTAGTQSMQSGTVIIAVENLSKRVSELSSVSFGFPSTKLTTIGVTGTNGKSTCVSLISQLHNIVGGRAASMGTVGLEYSGEKMNDFGMTTPDAPTCQKNLAKLVDQGAELVAMEVSSHGLEQGRVASVAFDVAVFTNITHDHLDYHGSLEKYCAAKQKLFEHEELKSSVINLDDSQASKMLFASKNQAKNYCYSLLHFVADFFGSSLQYTASGVEFTLTSPWGTRQVKSPLLGEFNVYNLMASISALCASGADFNRVVDAVPKLKSVEGRMQKASADTDITVIVDYAHTPDALVKALKASRCHSSGDLSVVFGCGGDRDTQKRPIMAAAAEQLADKIFVTSDNPRNEVPSGIIAEVSVGFSLNKHQCIEDRKEAITQAIMQAQSGDTVLIAGKGHEKYQVIGDQKIDFDDMKVAEQALQARKNIALQGVAL